MCLSAEQSRDVGWVNLLNNPELLDGDDIKDVE